MHRTIIIRREYLHYVPKYNRYEKRHKNLAAHVSPAFRVEEGDWVTVGQCRPLSKTVRGRSLETITPESPISESVFMYKLSLTTFRSTGPFQHPPCSAPHWQGRQGFQQVLSVSTRKRCSREKIQSRETARREWIRAEQFEGVLGLFHDIMSRYPCEGYIQ